MIVAGVGVRKIVLSYVKRAFLMTVYTAASLFFMKKLETILIRMKLKWIYKWMQSCSKWFILSFRKLYKRNQQAFLGTPKILGYLQDSFGYFPILSPSSFHPNISSSNIFTLLAVNYFLYYMKAIGGCHTFNYFITGNYIYLSSILFHTVIRTPLRNGFQLSNYV